MAAEMHVQDKSFIKINQNNKGSSLGEGVLPKDCNRNPS